MADTAVLEIPLYEIGEAARLLRLNSRTLRNWLEGCTTRTGNQKPVLRESPTGSSRLTWGEFVEAGFLREYRKKHKVALAQLRDYIDWWRKQLGIKYPLAHQQPYIGIGPDLMDTADTDAGQKDLNECERMVYRFRDGQLVIAPWVEEFLSKVEFEREIAHRYRPAGRDDPVVIDPQRSFGIPTVCHIRTEILYEMSLAGDPISDIADSYNLSQDKIESAIRFESHLTKTKAAALM